MFQSQNKHKMETELLLQQQSSLQNRHQQVALRIHMIKPVSLTYRHPCWEANKQITSVGFLD